MSGVQDGLLFLFLALYGTGIQSILLSRLHDRADKVWYMHIENKRKHIGILPVDVACNVAMSGRIHSPRSQVLFKKFSADCFDSK